MRKVEFRSLAIGTTFTLNGNSYTKATTRTALMHPSGRRFYVGQRELCGVFHA